MTGLEDQQNRPVDYRNEPNIGETDQRHGADEVSLARFGMSRTLLLQWTTVSTLGFVVTLAGFLGLYYAVTGDETGTTLGLAVGGVWWWSLALSFLVFLVLMVLVVVLHEFCHGAAIRAFGGKPRYGLGVAYFVFPYAFATTDTRLTRNQFVVVALTPLVVLTLLGVPVMILFEMPWLAIPLALNAGGAVGDVWMALLLLSYPPEVTVLDKETGVEVFGPPGTERWESAPAAVVWDVLVGFTSGVILTAVVVGVLAPFALSAAGIGSVTVGVPDSPVFLFEFTRTNGGAEFTAGPGIVIVGAAVGLVYAYGRARRRADA